jgi:hypothetical protein
LSISNFPLSSIIDFRTLSAQLMSPYSLFSWLRLSLDSCKIWLL